MLTLFSFLIALLFPIMIMYIQGKIHDKKNRRIFLVTVFAAYIVGILYCTLGGRDSGIRTVNLVPFWSYGLFSDPQYRWQIYMNVFLFMPFGVMLAFVAKRGSFQSLIIGFLLSVCIEAAQFIFCLGLCELDDVIHNSLGTALGYGQWKMVSWIEAKYGTRIRTGIRRMCQAVLSGAKHWWTKINNSYGRGKKK